MIEPIIAKKYAHSGHFNCRGRYREEHYWIAHRYGVSVVRDTAEGAIEALQIAFWNMTDLADLRRVRQIPSLIYTRIHGINE